MRGTVPLGRVAALTEVGHCTAFGLSSSKSGSLEQFSMSVGSGGWPGCSKSCFAVSLGLKACRLQ